MDTNVFDKFPRYTELPCGSMAQYDEGAGYGYRCEDCLAVVGSIGMPRSCAILLTEQASMTQVINKLKGKK